MSDHSTLPPPSERMRREVDPLGTRSAMSPEWTADTVALLVQDCAKATQLRFGVWDPGAPRSHPVVVTDEVAGFMQGFVAGRGFDVDITDALLVALNFDAV